MNREELIKMFDRRYSLPKLNDDNYIVIEKSDDIKSFIFDTIIPEVIKEILPCDKDVFEYVKNKSKQNFNINL